MPRTLPESGPVNPEHDVIYEFTPEMEARWTVPPGTTVTVRTIDSLIGAVETEDDLLHEVPERVNAATGPIAVEGARPGSILKVAIESVRVTDAIGRVTVLPGFGLQHGHDDTDAPRTRIADIRDGTVMFEGFELSMSPVIGTIGVAPRNGSYRTLVPHDHGGNLDTTDLTDGSTAYFPVFHPGGLLAMGDCKAVMGDGEVSGTGAEVATEIDVTLDVIEEPKVSIDRPLLETPRSWKTLASAETLETACERANEDLVRLLQHEHDLDFTDAYMLSSLVGDLEISQVVDPLVTVRNAVPKPHLTDPL